MTAWCRRLAVAALTVAVLAWGTGTGCTKKKTAAGPRERKSDVVRHASDFHHAKTGDRKNMDATATPQLPSSSIDKTDGLPSELQKQHPLWERTQSAAHFQPEHSERLYPDGRLYVWSNRRTVKGANGMPEPEPAPWAWRLDARINAKAMARVRDLVDSEFKRIPENPTHATGSRYPLYTWRAYPGGAEHVVVIPLTTPDEDIPKPIQEIEHAIEAGVVYEGPAEGAPTK